MSVETRRVDHPPIIDALMLIEFADGQFSKESAHALRKLYSAKDEELSQRLGDDEKLSDDFGFFNGESTDQSLIVLPDVVIFRDGRKYKDFETMLASVKKGWDAGGFDRIAKSITQIRFRVVNRFELQSTELSKVMTVVPNIALTNEDVLINSFHSCFEIRSEFRGASADVSVTVESLGEKTVKILLDIDTYLNATKDVKDFASFTAFSKRLSELKNDIFYSNIRDAKSRFNEKRST